ncbi:MAG TPA: hypothetical protein VK179_00985 [Bacteroidales bacterium]|nr:hypothetical protein [Bacteroidales bacterium]
MKLQYLFRGDSRDESAIKRSGGFVPLYLLNSHEGGFDGFVACNNKIDGKLGCKCNLTTEVELFNNARKKLKQMLLSPMDFQQHVIHNDIGLIAAAIKKDDSYSGYQYQIITEWEIDATIEEAAKELGLPVGRINAFSKNFRIVCNAKNLLNATLFGVIPHQAVEVSFVSPVEYKYIKCVGYKGV